MKCVSSCRYIHVFQCFSKRSFPPPLPLRLLELLQSLPTPGSIPSNAREKSWRTLSRACLWSFQGSVQQLLRQTLPRESKSIHKSWPEGPLATSFRPLIESIWPVPKARGLKKSSGLFYGQRTV